MVKPALISYIYYNVSHKVLVALLHFKCWKRSDLAC
jgi:hypothetical protein